MRLHRAFALSWGTSSRSHAPQKWSTGSRAQSTLRLEGSPLGIAWEWTRASPSIGGQTADVAVLVAMGCRIKQHMWCSNLWVVPWHGNKAAGIWETIRLAGSRLLGGGSQSESSYDAVQKPVQARDIEAERQAAEQSANLLRKAGERYSLLLGANDTAQERVEVDCIGSWTELIAATAAPLTPESALQLIPTLARVSSEFWVV